ncbi:restriction endonuclease subunit S [Ructibacterium gallinarum]|uniref:Restriction endonuclease subunit S n=1 Tax=Ructibacterium gallinarum TaxID=2779355 RepID=A0A9D5R8Z2_9FIRM|nr:restriction endonuclease subunit S [Ructibacterium gallinarum]MBE5040916.1 restriction endonuclease subunit S [Ructibacterium gallinarum]
MSEYMKLGDVCVFYSGTGFPSEYQGKIKGKFPFYKVGDISKNVMLGYKFLTFCDNYIDLIVAEKIKGVIVPSDTVVFAKIGEALRLNRRGITICDCLIDNNVMGIKPKTNYLNIGYFYYWMCNLDLQKYSESTTVPSVRKTRIEKIDILVPNIAEQLKIADTLDKVTALIDKHKKQLEKLDELVQARFVEMFGIYPENSKCWETGIIRDIVADVRYGSSRPAVDNGKYPYLRMNNITYDGELDLSDIKRIDIPDNELDKCTVRRGDVLFNRTNSKELVGKSCVYNRDEMMVLAGFVIRVRVTDRVLPEFLVAFLNTDFSKQMGMRT